MPIPNDDLKREWIDGSNNNPNLVDIYRPCLVAFLALNKDHVPIFAGSGFIIGSNGEFAFALTAKHVLTEQVLSIQRPSPRHAPSALPFFIPVSSTTPSIEESKLRAMWTDFNNADLLFTRHVGYNDNFDIACTLLEAQPALKDNFKPSSILLDANEPAIGDVVRMISLDKLEINNYTPPTDISGAGFTFRANRRVSIRLGTVTGVYPKGYRQYKWPCFTTSIPAEPGMSGGMVCLHADNGPISVCGIVCADASTDEARVNNTLCGESIIASAWTSLSLSLPEAIELNPPMISIYHLMKDDKLPAANGLENITYIDNGNGNWSITNMKS